MQRKPRVGISSCLLGHLVRFDGGHKREPLLSKKVGKLVEWVPVCPEFEVGMGVPREPVRLEGSRKSARMIGESSRRDWTRRMETYARRRVRQLKRTGISGFVLKQNSPSCGLKGVPLLGPSKRTRKVGQGLFAQALMSEMPLLPTAEEGHLRNPTLREGFLKRVFACHRWQKFLARGKSIQSLVTFHERHRLLLMAHGEAHLRRLDRIVGRAARAGSLPRVVRNYGEAFMEALRLTPTKTKREKVLRHVLGQLPGQVPTTHRAKLKRDLERYLKGSLLLETIATHLRRHAGTNRAALLENQLTILVNRESRRRVEPNSKGRPYRGCCSGSPPDER